MPVLTAGSSVTLTLTDSDSITVQSRGVATLTAVSGLGISAGRIAEVSGSRTFGPYSAGSITVEATNRDCQYEVADGVRNVTPTYTLDASGNAVGLAGPDGSVIRAFANVIGARRTTRQSGIEIFGPSFPVPTVTAGGGISSTSAITTPTIDGERWVSVTATADATGVNNYIELNLQGLPASFVGDDVVIEYQGLQPVGAIITPYIGTAGFAQFVTKTFPEIAPTGKGSFNHAGRRAMVVTANEWSKTGFAGTFASTAVGQMTWTTAKIRLTIPASQTLAFNLRSVRIGSRKAKGRICVVADDGYDSVYRRAIPLFEAYGVPLTMAIIPTKVGTAGYMTEAELRDLVDRGHMCVAHGPLQNNTNLFAAPYTATQQRLDDIQTSVQWLLSRGLTNVAGSRCYIWPEGFYSSTSGEADLLDAFFNAGFTASRGVGPLNNRGVFINGLSPRNGLRAVIPTIGHTYAGASNTADDAAETTNINQIVSNINSCAADGTDTHLMLHKFVARGAATAGGIEIEVDRLATLLDAIKTKVSAGTLEAVTMDVFA